MRTPKPIFIFVTILVFGVAFVMWALHNSKPPVLLTVLSYSTNRSSAYLAEKLGSSTYVNAIIAVTNKSGRSFTYFGGGSPNYADYDVLLATPLSWKARARAVDFRGKVIRQYALSPKQAFTFNAILEPNKLCKVALGVCDSGARSHWERLPNWLQRLPWLSPYYTVSTDPIDLRGSQP